MDYRNLLMVIVIVVALIVIIIIVDSEADSEADFCGARGCVRYPITVGGNTEWYDVLELRISGSNISYSHCDSDNLIFTYYNSTSGTERRVEHSIWEWDESGTSAIFLRLEHYEGNNGSSIYYMNCNTSETNTSSYIWDWSDDKTL